MAHILDYKKIYQNKFSPYKHYLLLFSHGLQSNK